MEKKKSRLKFKLQLGALAVIILVFAGVFYTGAKTISAIELEKQQVQKEIDKCRSSISELEKEKNLLETDAYVEKIARDELGLIKENEIIFKIK